ncbi:hypothetical protein, partial [Sporomusa ovata]|uniref:hypothetical protein n=1 Tax=Sporomusa ovata TaxID=2378 RepID=UPI0005644F48
PIFRSLCGKNAGQILAHVASKARTKIASSYTNWRILGPIIFLLSIYIKILSYVKTILTTVTTQ